MVCNADNVCNVCNVCNVDKLILEISGCIFLAIVTGEFHNYSASILFCDLVKDLKKSEEKNPQTQCIPN